MIVRGIVVRIVRPDVGACAAFDDLRRRDLHPVRLPFGRALIFYRQAPL